MWKMATAPVGAKVYQNPAGWAPLIEVDAGSATFYMMPGPPKEIRAPGGISLMLPCRAPPGNRKTTRAGGILDARRAAA